MSHFKALVNLVLGKLKSVSEQIAIHLLVSESCPREQKPTTPTQISYSSPPGENILVQTDQKTIDYGRCRCIDSHNQIDVSTN
jgi:hypothetical protein